MQNQRKKPFDQYIETIALRFELLCLREPSQNRWFEAYMISAHQKLLEEIDELQNQVNYILIIGKRFYIWDLAEIFVSLDSVGTPSDTRSPKGLSNSSTSGPSNEEKTLVVYGEEKTIDPTV